MLVLVTGLHVVLCVFMIFVILLQPGKDAGMGSALGGGSASSAFGGRGAVTFLSKVTAVCAVLFFLTSMGLSFVGMKKSVAEGEDASVAGPASPPAGALASPPGSPPASPKTGGAAAAAPAPVAPAAPKK